MKKMILFGLMLALLSTPAFAWVGEADLGTNDPGDPLAETFITGIRTLSSDTLYNMYGRIYVEDGAELHIPSGTIIKGNPAAVLVITRGAKIFATGTKHRPIIFTSSYEPGNRFPGDWGGIVILGKGLVNQGTAVIEGGIINNEFGGTDPMDSSGVFKYVRLEYPGYRYAEGNEINGVTMGGVGAGTEFHHVQVSYSYDDSFEWFGGSVNCSHLVAIGGTDDEFDTDFGYNGNLQFLFAMRDPDYFDVESTNGLESDNDGDGSDLTPYTWPVYSNITLVGPERTDALVGSLVPGHTFTDSARPRRNSRLSCFNSAFLGYPIGLSVRDGSRDAAAANDLRFVNVSVACATTEDVDCNTAVGYPSSVMDCSKWDQVSPWFDTPAYSNDGVDARMPSSIGLTDMSVLTNPNPVPAPGSELIGTADFSDSYLADEFFTPVTYRGAFDPSLAMDQQWTAVWTEFDPQNYVYNVSAVGDELPVAKVGLSNYPNPFNPMTTIKFSVPRAGNATLKVFNVRGQEVAVLHNGELTAGDHSLSFSGEGLPSGTYFYRLTGHGFEATEKMQLVK